MLSADAVSTSNKGQIMMLFRQAKQDLAQKFAKEEQDKIDAIRNQEQRRRNKIMAKFVESQYKSTDKDESASPAGTGDER